MEIIKLKLVDLTPYHSNAKEHPREQIEQIKKSIKKFGNNDPIAVWGEKNIIVEGHGRLMALKELGYEEVECIRLDHLTEEERRAYTLAHNQLTMNTGWDDELLKIELDDLSDFDMSDFGFSIDDIEVDEEKEREDLGDDLKDEYSLIVNCEDESQLEELYNEMMERGFSCRLSTL